MHQYSGFQTARPKTRAVVVGGGFIGIEMVENLAHRDFDVTLVEMLDQVLAPLDPENARIVEAHMEHNGVNLALGDGVAKFEADENGTLTVVTQSGATYPADIVILALGSGRIPPWRKRPGSRSASAAASASMNRCAPTCPIFSPSAMPWRLPTTSPGNRA
jgi:pyruvate/2-oxoglutarate dehydrogenase complex dihydrolipoamide dehydrogenase (E3) component